MFSGGKTIKNIKIQHSKEQAMTNPNAMRTVNDVLIETVNDWEDLKADFPNLAGAIESAMKAYAKEALELASKEGKITRETILDWQEIPRKKEFAAEKNFTQGTDIMYYVDKQSILTLIDQLK